MIKTQPDISIVALAGMLASAIFGHEMAHVVGPYIVIILASTVGASFALARRPPETRASAVYFFLRTVGLAILLTVALASIVTGYYPEATEKALIAPIAFVVGYIGDGWPAVFKWASEKINAFIDALIKSREGK